MRYSVTYICVTYSTYGYSGPAITLKVTINSENKCFSIDLVGALAFSHNDQWIADHKPVFLVPKYKGLWHLIPKPKEPINGKRFNNRDWICSYSEIERSYLRDSSHLKQLIRIFKKIRDKNNLSSLKSYYIKIMFLKRRLRVDNAFWKRSLGILFIEMLDIIVDGLATQKLMSPWHADYNLLEKLNAKQIDRFRNRVREVLNRSPPELIYTLTLNRFELERQTWLRSLYRINRGGRFICQSAFRFPFLSEIMWIRFVYYFHLMIIGWRYPPIYLSLFSFVCIPCARFLNRFEENWLHKWTRMFPLIWSYLGYIDDLIYSYLDTFQRTIVNMLT